MTDQMTGEEIDLATIEALAEHAIDASREALNARLRADTEGIGCTGVIVLALLALIVAVA